MIVLKNQTLRFNEIRMSQNFEIKKSGTKETVRQITCCQFQLIKLFWDRGKITEQSKWEGRILFCFFTPNIRQIQPLIIAFDTDSICLEFAIVYHLPCSFNKSGDDVNFRTLIHDRILNSGRSYFKAIRKSRIIGAYREAKTFKFDGHIKFVKIEFLLNGKIRSPFSI